MKLATFAATAAFIGSLAATVSAAAVAEVPVKLLADGTLPFTLCDSNAKYAISPEEIRLNPYPVVSSRPLQVTLTGELKTTLEQGAFTRVTASFGLFKQSMDLDVCAEAAKSNMTCPIAPGRHALTQTVDVPYVPFGGVNVNLNVVVKNANSDVLLCFNSKAQVVKS